MKIGVENTRNALIAIAGFASEVVEAMEDGKVKMGEVIGLSGEVFSLVRSLKSWENIKEEVKDLDEAERGDLVASFAAHFDIDSDEAEAKVEAAIDLIAQLIAFGSSLKK